LPAREKCVDLSKLSNSSCLKNNRSPAAQTRQKHGEIVENVAMQNELDAAMIHRLKRNHDVSAHCKSPVAASRRCARNVARSVACWFEAIPD
jgi:hypothetical protein